MNTTKHFLKWKHNYNKLKKFIKLFYSISELKQNRATGIVYLFPMQADNLQYMQRRKCVYIVCLGIV